MATSTAVLLPPEEIDDRAPPTPWRTKERRSQGYGKISESVLPVRRYILDLETCPRSEYSGSMS